MDTRVKPAYDGKRAWRHPGPFTNDLQRQGVAVRLPVVPANERVNLSEAAFAAAGNVGGTMGFMLWKQ
jgi:hypothetical protein